jgi:hypothetical protein
MEHVATRESEFAGKSSWEQTATDKAKGLILKFGGLE